MLDVVIDTSIYRSDPWRRGAGFKAIERFGKAGRLRLHVPYLVEREFVSQQVTEYKKQLDTIQGGISSLRRKRFPDDLATRLQELEDQFTLLRDQVMQHVETEFIEWARRIGATVHPVAESHGIRVMDDYFAGAPPFKAEKNRKDIPDAFIWQVVVDLSKEFEELIVVAGDSGLLDACESVPNIRAFQTLDTFLSSDVCRPLLREANVKDNLENLYRILPTRTVLLEQAVGTELDNRLYGHEVRSYEIPDDNNEATVFGVYEPESIEFDVARAHYYGVGVLVVPFRASLEAILWYPIFKADYYALGEEKAMGISISDWSDHYFAAEEEYPLYVEGTVSVEVDFAKLEQAELSDLEVEELIGTASVAIDSISEVGVEAETW